MYMVHLTRKKKRGIVYLYLEQTARVNGKSKRVWQKYLGREDTITERSNLRIDDRYSTRVLDLGLPVALLAIANELKLVDIINDFTSKRDQGLSVGHHFLLATLNRCVQPGSKSKLQKWLDGTYLPELLPGINVNVDASAYWTHFKYVDVNAIEQIEMALSQQLLDLYNVDLDCVLFDPTNFYTYINPDEDDEDESLSRHGHSKENRFVLNIVNLSLFCTRDGAIPLFHHVYPGNVQDSTHFKEMVPRFLSRLAELNRSPKGVTLVFDKGNISADAFSWLDEQKLQYIVSVRPTSHKDLIKIPPSDFEMVELPNKKEVGYLEFQRVMHGKNRRLIAIYNPRQASWQQKNLEKKISKRISDVHDFFKERLNKNKWTEIANVEKKIGALVGGGKYKKLIQYKTWVDDSGNGLYSISRDEAEIKLHVNTLGKSFLMTSQESWTAMDIVWTARQQFEIERVFKWLKHPDFLSIRPMFHHKDHCIRGHVFTCVLGYLLLSILFKKLRDAKLVTSLESMIDLLREIKVTRITFGNKGQVINKMSEISHEAGKIADYLKLKRFL
jgi:transposase